MKRRITASILLLIAILLGLWGYAHTRPIRSRIPNITRGVNLEGRVALAALMPQFNQCLSCCRVNRDQIIAQIEAMYDKLERTADGEFIYPDFFGGFAVSRAGTVSMFGGVEWLIIYVTPSKLEYARAHDAFSHFFAEGASHEYVEFSLTELLETIRRVVAIINERPDCIYSQNVYELRINPRDNVVNIYFGNQNNNPSPVAMSDGFRAYVYNSPLVEHRPLFFLPLGGEPLGFPIWFIVPISLFTVPALYLFGKEIKIKRNQREENALKPPSNT